jgi:apurinic endonuclease (APN1)
MTHIKIGSHVSMSGKEMLVGSVQEALSYNADTLMIYTGAPQNTRRKPINELNIEAGTTLLHEHNMQTKDIIVHAPYIINLANTIKPQVADLAVSFLRSEIERAEALGAEQIVLHPGAHVGEGAEIGIQSIIDGLNEVITPTQTVKIALETMAGKGSECGRTFEELAQIIAGVRLADKLSICFDTCHVWDAGYDLVNDYESVIQKFDSIIGLSRIGVLHINDSKNECGSHKDRHENIGFGNIGFETLNKIVHDERFGKVSRILETPYIPIKEKLKVAPYKLEIEMLRKQQFNHAMKEEIIATASQD